MESQTQKHCQQIQKHYRRGQQTSIWPNLYDQLCQLSFCWPIFTEVGRWGRPFQSSAQNVLLTTHMSPVVGITNMHWHNSSRILWYRIAQWNCNCLWFLFSDFTFGSHTMIVISSSFNFKRIFAFGMLLWLNAHFVSVFWASVLYFITIVCHCKTTCLGYSLSILLWFVTVCSTSSYVLKTPSFRT